jgi:hypothetical protein
MLVTFPGLLQIDASACHRCAGIGAAGRGCHDLARTSLHKTPCSVQVPAPDAGFSVSFAMPGFETVTVPVQVIRNPGDFASPPTTILEPSPVFAELKPAGPPPKARKPMRPKKKPKAAAAPAAAPAPPAR